MHLHSSEIVQDIILLSSDTEHIHAELASEACFNDGTVDHRRCRHDQNLSHSYIEEVEGSIGRAAVDLIGMSVKKPQRIILCKLLDHFRLSRKVQHIILLQDKVRRSKLLVDRPYEAVLTCTSAKLQNIDSIFAIYIKVNDSVSDGLRLVVLDMNSEKIVSHSVFTDKFLERFS